MNVLSWLLDPVKKTDIMVWCLNQLGTLQNGIKQINGKIGNIIETMTILEQRISTLENVKKTELKQQKRSVKEERFQII